MQKLKPRFISLVEQFKKNAILHLDLGEDIAQDAMNVSYSGHKE